MLWHENAGVFDPVCMAILAGYERWINEGFSDQEFQFDVTIGFFFSRSASYTVLGGNSLPIRRHSSGTQQDGICIL